MSAVGRRIVDAHFHLWDLDTNYYPWLSDGDRPTLARDVGALRRNYLVADLLRDIGDLDVVAGVHIQAEHDHRDTVRETRWLQGIADAPASRAFPQAIVADADFARPDIEAVLEGHCAFPNTRGIRHAFHRSLDAPVPYDPVEDPAWHRNFKLLKTYGLSFDLQLFPRQAAGALRLIRDNPDVPIILTHAAMPLWSDPDSMAAWRRAVTNYAALPNVAIKISGFGTHYPGYDARSIEPIVSHVVSAFGPARCMLASNYPIDGADKPYREIWNQFFALFEPYSENEKEQIFWRNAARIYRIEVPAAP